MKTVLFDYWRSSSSYRVRIALNMLGLNYAAIPVDLLKQEQMAPEHLARNPQGLVPVLEIDDISITQSLAIIEYLQETRTSAPFLPSDPVGRARVRSLAYAIAMEIHPICNLSVAAHVVAITDDQNSRGEWMRHFIQRGLAAFERMVESPATGLFCHGDSPTMADICLVPQLYNATRWDVDLSDYPITSKIGEACLNIPAFAKAAPSPPA